MLLKIWKVIFRMQRRFGRKNSAVLRFTRCLLGSFRSCAAGLCVSGDREWLCLLWWHILRCISSSRLRRWRQLLPRWQVSWQLCRVGFVVTGFLFFFQFSLLFPMKGYVRLGSVIHHSTNSGLHLRFGHHRWNCIVCLPRMKSECEQTLFYNSISYLNSLVLTNFC